MTRRWSDGTVERFRELAEPCLAELSVDGALRCFPPASRVSALAFADPSCEEALTVAVAGDPRFVVVRTEDGNAVREVRETRGEAEAFPETYRRGDDGACRASVTATAVRLSAPLDLDSFPALERHAVGRGRLQPLRLLDAAGRAWPVRPIDRYLGQNQLGAEGFLRVSFRDTERREDCLPEPTVEGVRCLPLLTLRHDVDFEAPSAFFRDAACTQRVLWAQGPQRDRVSHVAEWGVTGEGCGLRQTVLRVRQAGPPLATDAPLFRLNDGTCRAFDRSVGAGRMYDVSGPGVDLGSFAAFRESPYDR